MKHSSFAFPTLAPHAWPGVPGSAPAPACAGFFLTRAPAAELGGGGGGRGGRRSPWRRSLSRRGRRAVAESPHAQNAATPGRPVSSAAPPAARLASRQSQHRAAIHLGDLVKINKPTKIHWRAMHHRPGGLLRGSLRPRLQPLLRRSGGRPAGGAGGRLRQPGSPPILHTGPRQGLGPPPDSHPSAHPLSPQSPRGAAHPTAAAEHRYSLPCISEGGRRGSGDIVVSGDC